MTDTTDYLRSRIIAHRDQPDIYDPPTREDMYDRILANAETIKALTEALKPFAQVPQFGRSGGPLVLAVPGYEDGSEGSDLPRTPTWRGHIPHEAFTRARDALNAALEKNDG